MARTIWNPFEVKPHVVCDVDGTHQLPTVFRELVQLALRSEQVSRGGSADDLTFPLVFLVNEYCRRLHLRSARIGGPGTCGDRMFGNSAMRTASCQLNSITLAYLSRAVIGLLSRGAVT
jgi:hypothetical protein